MPRINRIFITTAFPKTIPSMTKKTLRLVIYGHVQGVFFRDSMRRKAQNLAVAGWVRNRSDGSVEAVVQGEPADVDAIVCWARGGPGGPPPGGGGHGTPHHQKKTLQTTQHP